MEFHIDAIDDIDLSRKQWHTLRALNVILKPAENTMFEKYRLLHGTLPCYNNAINGQLRSAKQVVLVDLGEFNLFQFAQSCLRPADTFVLGVIGRDKLFEYMRAIYEQSTSYNALKAELSVEICVPRQDGDRAAFFYEAYSYLNAILDPMIKIMVIQTPPGIFQRENFTNERGRSVKSVSPQNLGGRIDSIEDLTF